MTSLNGKIVGLALWAVGISGLSMTGVRLPWTAALIPKVEAAPPIISPAWSAEGQLPSDPPPLSQIPELVPQIGHRGSVLSIAFSPDGRTIASTADDGTVKLWNTASGELLWTLRGQTSPTFLRDGSWLLTVSVDKKKVTIWEPDQRVEIQSIHTAPGPVAVSMGGRLLAGVPPDDPGQVALWDLDSGDMVWNRESSGGRARLIRIAPDNSSLLVGGVDNSLQVLSLQTGQTLFTLSGRTGASVQVAFSADAAHVVAASEDSALKVWDSHTGVLVYSLSPAPDTGSLRDIMNVLLTRMGESSDYVDHLALPAGGSLVATGQQRGAVRIWNTATGKLALALHADRKQINQVAISPGGTRAASSWDGGIDLWDCTHGTLLRTLPPALPGVLAFSPDGLTLAAGYPDGRLRLFSSNGAYLRTLGQLINIRQVVVLGQTGLLAAASEAGVVDLWSLRTGALVYRLAGHQGEVLCVAASPDGRILASGGADHQVILWDTQYGTRLTTLTGHLAPVTRATFSPDGLNLVTADGDGHLLWWRLNESPPTPTEWDPLAAGRIAAAEFQTRVEYQGGPEPAAAVISPNGKTLASWDHQDVQLWDTQTHTLQRVLHASIWIQSVCFSPDSRLVAVGASWASLWDIATGERRWNLPVKVAPSIAFSPDGSLVGIACWDKTVHLVNSLDGQTVAVLNPHGGSARSLAFSPDGSRLVVSSDDGAIRIWDMQTLGLLATLLTLAEDEGWFAMTPQGYFDCSAHAAHFVRWQVGEQLYAAERYIRPFRRPDLVQTILRGEPLDAPPVDAGDVPPMAYFSGLYKARSASTMIVSVDAFSKNDIQEVKLLANDRPLPVTVSSLMRGGGLSVGNGANPGERGAQPILLRARPIRLGNKPIELGARPIELGARPIELGARPIELGARPIELGARAIELGARPIRIAPRLDAETAVYTRGHRYYYQVQLPANSPSVQLKLVVFDRRGLGSAPCALSLRQPKATPAPGNLYVLCVGISHYKYGSDRLMKSPDSPASSAPGTPQFSNLRFPAADALAVARRFNREGKPLYNRGFVKTLIDSEATLPAIRGAIEWLRRSVRPGSVDTVMIFMSGHGVSDTHGHYYFPTYEFDSHKREYHTTSLSGTELQERLGAQLPARAIFLFLDSCHSGAMAGARTDDLSFDLGSGVHLMASSGANEYSYETPTWGHGGFTLALLKCLGRRDLAEAGVIHYRALANAVPRVMASLLRAAGHPDAAQRPVTPLDSAAILDPVARPQPPE